MVQAFINDAQRRLTRICSVENGIACIRLDRPDKANGVSSNLLADMLAAMVAAEEQPDSDPFGRGG